MRKINQFPGWIFISFMAVSSFSACKKESRTYTPVPFLTGRTWIAETITINPPMTYAQLSSTDQQSYRAANGWFKIARLALNDDGTVTYNGDYDFGYKTWRLINNNLDIEMTIYNGSRQVLRNWGADSIHFSYSIPFNSNFDCTLVYEE
jgi:hypothetical protein